MSHTHLSLQLSLFPFVALSPTLFASQSLYLAQVNVSASVSSPCLCPSVSISDSAFMSLCFFVYLCLYLSVSLCLCALPVSHLHPAALAGQPGDSQTRTALPTAQDKHTPRPQQFFLNGPPPPLAHCVLAPLQLPRLVPSPQAPHWPKRGGPLGLSAPDSAMAEPRTCSGRQKPAESGRRGHALPPVAGPGMAAAGTGSRRCEDLKRSPETTQLPTPRGRRALATPFLLHPFLSARRPQRPRARHPLVPQP